MKRYLPYVMISALSVVSSIHAATQGSITQLKTEQDFNSFLSNNTYVLVQFLNPSCPYCQKFKSTGTYPELAQMFPNIGFAEVSSAQDPDRLFKTYKITSTPTFIFFKKGKQARFQKGFTGTAGFTEWIQKAFPGVTPAE